MSVRYIKKMHKCNKTSGIFAGWSGFERVGAGNYNNK